MNTRRRAGRCSARFSGGELRHTDQAVLNAAVAGATRRPYGDAWAWSRKSSSVDISPLVAASRNRPGLEAVPTTLVIDAKGRVAARVLGRIEASTLKALIKRVVEEG